MAYTNEELLRLRNEHIPQGAVNVAPVFIQKATGALLTDVEGNEYIDFAGGIGVNNVGHSHPKVVQAIKDQAEKFIHTCFHISMYDSYVELAKQLNEMAPGDSPKMTMFANSGAEAVENAVKIARYATGREAIICFENGFHGRTLLGMSLTSKVKPYKFNFGPFAPEIYRVPYAYCYRCSFGLKYPDCQTKCADYLEDYFIGNVAPESTAAIIAEPIQGEGGFITPPPEYFPKLKKICDKYGILLIADEIQTGAGRTGKYLAIEHWGVEPDIITMAKSFAGGMPLSAITGRSELMNKPHVGGLGGTYGGNPVACKAALAVLEILTKEGLIQKAESLGGTIASRFKELQEKHELIGEVRGLGPMLALELVKDRQSKEPAAEETKKLVQLCFEKGLIVLSCGNYGNVIRTLMPLVITDEQLDKGISILDESLEELRK
ncbi:MAG: 4-aminobutyrate--2-oxoglutarate transaminase [Deltaproteobacteria bacterium]|nr:4-aminobutyrate--2-oxoglutarate transaminase [Deltaproteobacteria bacterium]MBT7153847.1 4-aminobutyrate--2-oxoglutarate transaminase [Deltaproteobacteria bacterium]MBT7888500.1 4-aminobutyrate--2-oxoglutarate transaminase [Deltaproteobacteria bacterium]